MKKIFYYLMGIIGTISLACCDKINPEEYTIYDGAVIKWEKTNTTITPVQRVYVEKYTGPKCNNCPLADATLNNIHNENVVVVSINHPTGQGTPFPDQPDMRTDGGNAWDNYFGINAIPSAFINRDQSKLYQGSMDNIVSDIDQALSTTPIVALDVAANATLNNDYVFVNIDLMFAKAYNRPVTMTVALIEDSLYYKQLLPDNSVDENYVHNHMLRKVITGFWGRDVEATGTAGECVLGELEFSPSDDVKLQNCHIVAFVSDKSSRKVLNVASCKIE